MNYWKIAPGDKGSLWVEQRDKECIAIGWNDVGNLRRFHSDEEIRQRFSNINDYEGSSPRQLLTFFHEGELQV